MVTYTSITSGNWTDPTTWDVGSGYPVAGDTTIISTGDTVTVTSNAEGSICTVNGILIATGATLDGFAFNWDNIEGYDVRDATIKNCSNGGSSDIYMLLANDGGGNSNIHFKLKLRGSVIQLPNKIRLTKI